MVTGLWLTLHPHVGVLGDIGHVPFVHLPLVELEGESAKLSHEAFYIIACQGKGLRP